MKIPPHKSIKEDFDIDLGSYTILAGENNAGKSNILTAINEVTAKTEGKKKIVSAIFVQSSRVSASEETKTTGPSSFRDIISPILKEIFSQDTKPDNTGILIGKIQDDLNAKNG